MLTDAPGHAVIPASDLERAKRFYRGVLGLMVVMEPAGGVLFQCGGTELFVYLTDSAGRAHHTLANWRVRDLDAEMRDLRAREVVFEEYDFPGLKTVNGVADMGLVREAWFKDSEGNTLAVMEMREP